LTEPNEYGVMGCDPPLSLLRSAARAAANSTLGVEFVVFTGDFVRHGTDQFSDPWENVTGTIHEVAEIIQTEVSAKILGYAGETQSFGTFGNNDSPQNYFLNVTTDLPQNPWVSDVGGALLSAGVMSNDTVSSYSYGGFFEEVMGGLTIVTINTIIYSVSHSPVVDPLPEDPFRQFAWLRSRLEAAAEQNRTVWIVGHIPPGIETYGYSELWSPAYVRKYLDIVQDPVLGPTVAAQIFGHVHKEEFRLLPNAPAGAGPILLTAAISPIYENNPPFRFFEYDPATQRPVTYTEFFAELPQGSEAPEWRFGYDLLEAYEVLRSGVERAGALLHSHVESLADRMVRGTEDWDTYARWYATQAQNDLAGCSASHDIDSDSQGNVMNQAQKLACRERYRCAMTVSTQEQFNRCVGISAWQEEGQKLSAPLLRHRQDLYYAVQHEFCAAELRGERERADWLRHALSNGRWQDVETWARKERGPSSEPEASRGDVLV